MKLTQIRNATMVLEYAGKKFLIDPMLAPKHTFDSFQGFARPELRNPMVDLPVTLAELIDVDAVFVTHTHIDHWDEEAQKQLPKAIPIYTQNAADADLIRSQGFNCVFVLQAENRFLDGITVCKTDGQHGSNELYADPVLAEMLGDACGLVFTHPAEKKLYLAGDTVWVKPYIKNLLHHKPDVVVLNIGYAVSDIYGPIIMGKDDALRTLRVLPETIVVASHMEAVNHCILSRDELRQFSLENNIAGSVMIPEDGESLVF
ncbi:MBL fold metallo-hydrolase [Erwinia sp. Eh17-17]|jgi:L-ascorbate metabolism protein UlaG (beta-lactamase superfamily)|uniref:MBL fold metallo-hydrolase n=1 Tax=Erwinia sp. Eh17-17 TaxID=3080330 RepID=UPI0032088DF6